MNYRNRYRGFSLVELMIAMVLGLVIVGGVVSVMLANKRSYNTNAGLSQIQESTRTAYEMLARDIRQTGGTGCDNAQRMANAFAAGAEWWRTWFTVRGFDAGQADSAVGIGTGANQRVAGTDSLHMHSIEGGGFPVDTHDATARTIRINNANATSFAANEQLLICDFDHTAMFRATAYDGGATTLSYSTTGNCSSGLGFPTNCDGGTGNVYTFPRNSWVGRLSAVAWYIGNNGRADDGGRSLFRRRLSPNGVVVIEEIVSGVTDMQLRFGINGSDNIVDPTTLVTAADWATVNSVFITLTVMTSSENVSTDRTENSGRLERTFTYLIALRNRLP